MVDFRNIKKFATNKPLIRVDAGLPVGRYVFQLTAIDKDGNSSKPTKLNLEIVRGPVFPGPIIVNPPPVIGPVIRGPIGPIRPRR